MTCTVSLVQAWGQEVRGAQQRDCRGDGDVHVDEAAAQGQPQGKSAKGKLQ